MARTDLKQTDNDIVILDNDLIIAESDDQHIQDTIEATFGWWKQTFTEGVGIMAYLKSRDAAELSRTMKINLELDGYICDPIIKMDGNGTLIVNPNVNIQSN